MSHSPLNTRAVPCAVYVPSDKCSVSICRAASVIRHSRGKIKTVSSEGVCGKSVFHRLKACLSSPAEVASTEGQSRNRRIPCKAVSISRCVLFSITCPNAPSLAKVASISNCSRRFHQELVSGALAGLHASRPIDGLISNNSESRFGITASAQRTSLLARWPTTNFLELPPAARSMRAPPPGVAHFTPLSVGGVLSLPAVTA